MRFLFLPFFSFFLSLSFFIFHYIFLQKYIERESTRYRRHSVRAQPSYYIRRPHFHLKELWPLWRLLDHSLWSLWKSVVIRLRMRVDRMPCIFYAESCAPSSNYRFREALRHSRRKEVLPRFGEGKICRLTVVFVSSKEICVLSPLHDEFDGRTSAHLWRKKSLAYLACCKYSIEIWIIRDIEWILHFSKFPSFEYISFLLLLVITEILIIIIRAIEI